MSLFVLVLFIYACVGINLFAKIKERDVLNDKFNFQTFGNSMVTLMKFATGDDWSAFMIEATMKDDCEVSTQFVISNIYNFRDHKHTKIWQLMGL